MHRESLKVMNLHKEEITIVCLRQQCERGTSVVK
jgi:hypothetical protein